MKIIFPLLFLAGQVTVISSVLSGKDYTKIKAILMVVYLFIGINVPFVVYSLVVFKTGHHIPFLSSCIAAYEWGLCLIGFIGIFLPIYKTIKKRFATNIQDIDINNGKESS